MSQMDDVTPIPSGIRGQFLDLLNPASCDGTLTSLSLCFPLILSSQEPQKLLLRIWRRQPTDRRLLIAGNIALKIAPLNQLSGQSSGDCIMQDLELMNHVDVIRGDVLGVVLPNQDLSTFAVISDGINVSGLYQDTRSNLEHSQPLALSNLILRGNLTLNIHANYTTNNISSIISLQPSSTVSPQASIQDQINTIQPSLTAVHKSTMGSLSMYLPTPSPNSRSTPQVSSTSPSPADVTVVATQSLIWPATNIVSHSQTTTSSFTPAPENTQTSGFQSVVLTLNVSPTLTREPFMSTEPGVQFSSSLLVHSTTAMGTAVPDSVGSYSTELPRLPQPTPSISSTEVPVESILVGTSVVMTSGMGSGITTAYSGVLSRSSLFGLVSTPVQNSLTISSMLPETSAGSSMTSTDVTTIFITPSFTLQPSTESVRIAISEAVSMASDFGSAASTQSMNLDGQSNMIRSTASALESFVGILPTPSEDLLEATVQDSTVVPTPTPEPSPVPSSSLSFSPESTVELMFSLEPTANPETTNALSATDVPTTSLNLPQTSDVSSFTIPQPSLSSTQSETSTFSSSLDASPLLIQTRVNSRPTPSQPSSPSTQNPPPTVTARELTGSLIAVTVAVCFLFATLSGCIMVLTLYVAYCRSLAKMDQVSSRGKNMIGMGML